MASYSPPEWGSSGANVFGLCIDVIKGGVVIETLNVPCNDNCSYVLVGRMETVCDLTLAHPSISRTHAALQFDEQGALFLYDFRSTHGCFVNKKRIPVEEFVRLHIGDVLGFGESTRLYAVCGPPELLPAEYESLNLVKFRERMTQKKEKQGVSWGFKDDAEEEEEQSDGETHKSKEELPEYLRNLKEEDQPYTSSVNLSEVNEKDQRLYHQLQTRIRKMENLKLEKSRILAKQNRLDGLSEGQQLTLERNEQRIGTLLNEIDDLEARIQAKNDQRLKTKGTGGAAGKKKVDLKEELYGYSSDEDDFYDRTKANQQKFAARKEKVIGNSAVAEAVGVTTDAKDPKRKVLTADSIQHTVKKLEMELIRIQDDAIAASTRGAAKQDLQEMNNHEEEDSLDSFMASTTTQFHVSEVDLLKTRQAEVETELQLQRHLLALATPALAALPVRSPVKEAMDMPVKSPARISLLVEKAADQAEIGGGVLLKKATICGPVTVEVAIEGRASLLQNKMILREKAENNREKKALSPKRRRISGPVKETALPEHRPASGKLLCEHASILEGGDHAWLPPTNQSGDGRTKLNDKFGY